MRVLVAPDSFKGSLTAGQAAAAMARGLVQAGIEPDLLPLGDGGEGTLEALVTATGGSLQTQRVTGPLGQPVDARWGLSGDGQTAFIEMAEASGLLLLLPEERNVRAATTYGTGELIATALASGVRRIIVLLGGSATNDGGAGMAQALGYRLLDSRGRSLPLGGGALTRLHTIEPPAERPWEGVEVLAACDVDNPLTGRRGASAVYGPQKGATPEDVAHLDRGLKRLAQVLAQDISVDVSNLPGGGAAGGLGAGLAAFLGASLRPGIDLVLDAVGFEDHLRKADWVMTGEGRTDAQTLRGKVPLGVARRAAAQNVPVICLSGGIAAGYEELYSHGMTAVLSISQGPGTLVEAITRAPSLLEHTAHAVGRLLVAARRGRWPD